MNTITAPAPQLFVFVFETRFCHAVLAGLELLASSHPPKPPQQLGYRLVWLPAHSLLGECENPDPFLAWCLTTWAVISEGPPGPLLPWELLFGPPLEASFSTEPSMLILSHCMPGIPSSWCSGEKPLPWCSGCHHRCGFWVHIITGSPWLLSDGCLRHSQPLHAPWHLG